jgi:hypothetical protein
MQNPSCAEVIFGALSQTRCALSRISSAFIVVLLESIAGL